MLRLPPSLRRALTRALLLPATAALAFAIDLAPTADAYVRSGTTYQNSNFGTLANLDIKKSAVATDDFNREIYLKFDLTGVSSIRTAILRLYGSDTSPQVITTDVYSASNTTWTETGITWANKPATGPVMWSTVGIQNAPAWHEWNITQFLQGEKAMGRNTVTLVLKNSVASTTGTISFNSRTAASNQPMLRITEAHPWTYYEAEAYSAKHSGATVDTGTSWGQVAFEARGKKTVTLNATGEYVQWTNVKAATHATVRYSIADGATGTLALIVNGTKLADLALTSSRMRETKTGGAAPPSETVRYFDDVMAAVTIPANATIRLEKQVSGTTDYVIDFLEVESAPAANTKPDSTWVEVAQGTSSDRMAFVTAINTANAGSKKVWLPAGNYTINPPVAGEPNLTGYGIAVPAGIEIRGAGKWHTRITKNYAGDNRRIFSVTGNNAVFRDFKVIGTLTTLSGNGQNVVIRADSVTGTVVNGVWTEYTSLFLGFHANGSAISHNRIRNTYKDSIHLARTASSNLVEYNSIRNAGDDSVAFVAYENVGMIDNTSRYNLSECSYWGRGMTILGGDGNVMLGNVIIDASRAGILVMTETYSGQTTQHCTDFVVEKNVIVRCGNDLPSNNNTSGAIVIEAKIDAAPMQGRMESNYIVAPPFNGSILASFVGDTGTSNLVNFRYNVIEAPTSGGTWVRKKTTGLAANHNCVHTPNTDL